MVKFSACIFQRSENILLFEIGQFLKYFCMAETIRQQVEDIDYPYTQSPYAWSPTTLFGINRNAFLPISHNSELLCSACNVMKNYFITSSRVGAVKKASAQASSSFALALLPNSEARISAKKVCLLIMVRMNLLYFRGQGKKSYLQSKSTRCSEKSGKNVITILSRPSFFSNRCTRDLPPKAGRKSATVAKSL
jgi:hypothetical protein